MSNLVLDGVNANPVSYSGLSKFDHEWLKNIRYLMSVKESVKEVEVIIDKKDIVKKKLLSQYKLVTYNNESCVKFSDIKDIFKATVVKRINNNVITTCGKTNKVINVFDVRNKTQYITFSWLVKILSSDFANVYFVKSAIKSLTN